MPKIPLRSYNREIENLIDRGQTEEAIAHCKYLLQAYPKYLDAYRLLGKAYLESQRYSEAVDILQRVLSSIPDDFVCQVGMSIIREDEGNLDRAIAHMERAYEIQPSNAAVQEELRRLYGRRDGVEPPRVRLTRGSLARMYARGDLYHQAIAEIKSALDEDPQRLDLQVLLAHMYYLAGQRVEAAEVCGDLLNKYPYCLEANQILAEILTSMHNAAEADAYLQRLYALDPYLAFVLLGAEGSGDAPENTVMIDKLEWDPSQSQTVTPGWSEQSTPEPETAAPAHELPGWLASLSPAMEETQTGTGTEASQPPSPADSEFLQSLSTPAEPETPSQAGDPSSAEAEEAAIPEWMKEAGWVPSSTAEQEPPVQMDAAPEEAVASDSIPEWLRSLAPPPAEGAGQGNPTSENDLSWLSEIAKEQNLPSAFAAPIAGDDLIQGVPDWLNPGSEAAPSDPTIPSSNDQPEALEATVPSWLENISPSQPSVSEAGESPSLEGAPNVSTEIPEWLKSPEPTVEGLQRPPAAQPDEAETTQAWLENIAVRHSSEAETLIAKPEDRLARPPEWIKKGPPDEAAEVLPEAAPTDEPAAFTFDTLGTEEETDTSIISTEGAGEWIPEESFSSAVVSGSLLDELVDPGQSSQQKDDFAQEGFDQSIEDQVAEIETQPDYVAAGPDTKPLASPEEKPIDEVIDRIEEESLAEATPDEFGGESALPGPSQATAGELPEWLKLLEQQVPGDEPVRTSPQDWSPEPAFEDTLVQPETSAEASVEPQAESPSEVAWFDQLIDEDSTQTPGEPELELDIPNEAARPSAESSSISQPQTSWQDTTSENCLYEAQMAMMDGQISQALASYNRLISKGELLEETIHDLRDAVYRYPVDVSIWQTLGDAYMRANQIQEALDAYTKAEELIR